MPNTGFPKAYSCSVNKHKDDIVAALLSDASTSQAEYRPPKPACYQTPAWSERMTSNIGQLDTYGHLQSDRNAPCAPLSPSG